MRSLRGAFLLLPIFFFAAFFAASSASAQQTLKPSDPIPIDPAITYGKFDNGLQYYIKTNKKPEKRAELRLAVKTGSVMEDDDQLGLAHFCEHMAFNGTKSFPKNEIVNLLEKEGIRLGPDVNAYTSFDQTVYMLQIPTDSAEIVEKAFRILEEWASAVTYEGSEIDKERGVVVEEWRLGRGASARIFDKHIPKLLYNSQYAKRWVIGKKEILENAPYETLRRFYRDWYRPELMAVSVVGDFDKVAMEKMVKEHFSKLTNRRPARERTEYTVPDHTQTLVSVATDKEMAYTSVQMYLLRDLEIEKTFADSRKSLISQLYDGMFDKRLQERMQQPNPPFIYGGANDAQFLGHRQAYILFLQAKENSILDGLDYIITEAYRVKQSGFTSTELERQKTEILRRYERMVNEKDKTESRNYADEYIRNFLQQEPIPGIEVEYAVAKQFLPGITLDEVNKLADVKMVHGNRVVTVSAPEKEGVKIPTEAEVMAVIETATTKKTEAYVDKVINKPLIAALPKSGKVVSEKTTPSIGMIEWKLSNGALVVLKPTDFKNDEILFSAYSNGGTSLSSDPDFMSASFAGQVASVGGVGEFDAISLSKLLTGKIVNVNPMISPLSEGFSGSASPKDLETLFQLTYLYATAPRKDTSAFGAIMTRYRASLQNRSVSPEAAFYDTVSVTMAQYHYRARAMTPKLLDEIKLDKAFEFYKDRFADASDFTFFFVGSFQLEKIKPLVEQYLASLPSISRKESWRDPGIYPPKGVINKEVYRGVEPKSSITINFTGLFEWNTQNRYDFNSLLELTNIKLREVIREEKGGTYGIGSYGAPSLYPHKEFNVSVSWGCNPTRVDELVKTVMVQLDSLRMQGPDQVYVDKVKEIQRRNREVNLKENRFWLSQFRVAYANGENPEELLGFNKLVDNLSVGAMQSAAKKFFDTNNMVKVVLFPEKK
ncbi:MAG: insulinase family protein [Ignavibacteriales bacterium]|nr:insulinase family protein [Ignavibacteriales bacterium]